MVNKSVVAKSNEDVYPKSLEAMKNKSVNPWAVVIRLLRSGRLLSVANQSSLPYSESYLRHSPIFRCIGRKQKQLGIFHRPTENYFTVAGTWDINSS